MRTDSDPDSWGTVVTGAIAVIGLACRLPGASNPKGFWGLPHDGIDTIIEAPKRRREGVSPSHRFGGFVDKIDGIDPDFFGISPREATTMDPQQRLMLELSWEALEDARIIPARLQSSRTGVFVGTIWNDYATLTYRHGTDAVGQYTITGSHHSMITNRVSYVLDLHGISLTVDTGQFSSLVAVHLACESLRHGESAVAIAGGVNLNILNESTQGWLSSAACPPKEAASPSTPVRLHRPKAVTHDEY